RHRQSKLYALVAERLENLKQRNVRLTDCFKEPVFFEEIVVFGMANKRQVGMKDQAQVTGFHNICVAGCPACGKADKGRSDSVGAFETLPQAGLAAAQSLQVVRLGSHFKGASGPADEGPPDCPLLISEALWPSRSAR